MNLSYHECVAAGVAACAVCVATLLAYLSYCIWRQHEATEAAEVEKRRAEIQEAVERDKAKGAAVAAMAANGMSADDVKKVLDAWDGESVSDDDAIRERRQEMFHKLQEETTWTPAEIQDAVDGCLPIFPRR